MKIISTNIGTSKTVEWQGKEIQTGIFKYPVNEPIVLEKTDVKGDQVIDRKYHGGEMKACYIYSHDHYAFWKAQYPDLDWDYGMFGENLTVQGLNEATVKIGDVYTVGAAKVQVTQPRQPCFKLGIRFQDQGIIKKFVDQPYPGVYLAVLENGAVKKGDEFQLVERREKSVSIAEVYHLLFQKPENIELAQMALEDPILPINCKDSIRKKFMKNLV